MEKTNRLILSKISENEMLQKLSSKEENIKITSLLIGLPFFNQLIFDIGHDLLQNVISTMRITDIKKDEVLSSNNSFLYFLIKGEIFSINSHYKDFSNTVDGPLNFLNRNNITNIDKNIVPIKISALSESIIIQISIEDINKAKSEIAERDVSDFRYCELLTRHLSKLQIEKMNKYTTRRVYQRNDKVYLEGDEPNEVFFIKKGTFRLTKKRRNHTDYATKINLIESELQILSKQADVYNYCLNGNYSLNTKYIKNLNKQIENEKTSLPAPIAQIDEVIINLMLIRENNLFGEIELFKKQKKRTHNVVCVSDIAEVLVLTYEYFMMLCPQEMLNEIEAGAITKCTAMNVKFSEDCEAKDSQKRDKEKYNELLKKKSKPHSCQNIIYVERNPSNKPISTKSNFFKARRTHIKFPMLPRLVSCERAEIEESKEQMRKSSSMKFMLKSAEEKTKNTNISEMSRSTSCRSIINNYYINERNRIIEQTKSSFFNKKFQFVGIKNPKIKLENIKCNDCNKSMKSISRKKINFNFNTKSMKTLLLNTNPKDLFSNNIN